MRLRTKLSVSSAICVAVTTALVSPSSAASPNTDPPDWPDPNVGVFSQHCNFTGQQEKIDPIRNHGEAQSMHLHQFFGTKNITKDTTRNTLLAPGGADHGYAQPTTCNRKANRSSYWAPALHLSQTGPAKEPDYARIYYRRGGIAYTGAGSTPAMPDLPPYLAMIAGSTMQTTPNQVDTRILEWACVDAEEGSLTGPKKSIPDTCGPTADYIRMRVTFPNCWDGTTQSIHDGDMDWAQGQHLIYSFQKWAADGTPDEDESSNRFARCDTASVGHHYTPIPAIQLGVRWKIPDSIGGADIPLPYAWLDSDMLDGQPWISQRGSSGHADFMNGWAMANDTPPAVGTLSSLINNCLDSLNGAAPGDCEDDECSPGIECPADPRKSDPARYALED